MPTTRETILQALLAALKTVPGATVLRGAILPERIPSGGLLILRDGDPGTPEVTLSPLQYHYEHRAEVEVIVQGKTPAARDAAFDALLDVWPLFEAFQTKYVAKGLILDQEKNVSSPLPNGPSAGAKDIVPPASEPAKTARKS